MPGTEDNVPMVIARQGGTVSFNIDLDLQVPRAHSFQAQYNEPVLEDTRVHVECSTSNQRSAAEMASSSITWTYNRKGDILTLPHEKSTIKIENTNSTKSRAIIDRFDEAHAGSSLECMVETGSDQDDTFRTARGVIQFHLGNIDPGIDWSKTDDVDCVPKNEKANRSKCNNHGICKRNLITNRERCVCDACYASGASGSCIYYSNDVPTCPGRQLIGPGWLNDTSSFTAGLIILGICSMLLCGFVISLSLMYRKNRLARTFSQSYKALRRSIRLGRPPVTDAEMVAIGRQQYGANVHDYCWQCHAPLTAIGDNKQFFGNASAELRLQMPPLGKNGKPGGHPIIRNHSQSQPTDHPTSIDMPDSGDLYRCASSPDTPGLLFPCYDPECLECAADVRVYAFPRDVAKQLNRTDRRPMKKVRSEDRLLTVVPVIEHSPNHKSRSSITERGRLFGESDTPNHSVVKDDDKTVTSMPSRARHVSTSMPPSPKSGVKRAAFHEHRSDAVELYSPSIVEGDKATLTTTLTSL